MCDEHMKGIHGVDGIKKKERMSVVTAYEIFNRVTISPSYLIMKFEK